MASTINASSGATSGLISTGDATGILALQTGASATTALTLSATQAATFAGTATFPTTIGVGNATPSASGAGVSFPATQSASTDANTLDDYEEGTWTPVLGDGNGNSCTMTSGASGRYTKIGNVVMVVFNEISYSSKSTLVSDILITGLPFTTRASMRSVGAFASATSGTFTSGINRLLGYVEGSTTTITIITINSTTNFGAQHSSSLIGATGTLYAFQLTYLV